MTKIYGTAQEVVIWLGEEGEDSSPALELLTNIVAGSKMDYGDQGAMGLKHNLVKAGMVAEDHPAWKSLTAFLCRPWFTRVWVVQEAVMAQKVIITCGNRRIDWNDLHTAVESIEGINYGQLIETRHLRIMSLHRYRRRRAEKDLALSRLLFVERPQSATDDRDKVFALLGLATDGLPIQANYHLKTAQVYIEVARSIIAHTQSLSILTSAGLPESLGRYKLPSWVPDWSSTTNAWPLMQSICEANYSASAGKPAKRQPSIGDSLSISMLCHDTISDMRPALGRDNQIKTFLDWIRLSKADEMGVGHNSIINFYRTIVANIGIEGNEPVYFERISFLEWFRRVMKADGKEISISALGFPEERVNEEVKELMYTRFGVLVNRACGNRRFFVTEKGGMGIGARNVRVGDKVCVVEGACVPLILREMEGEEGGIRKFLYIGDSYVDGIMRGEAYDESKMEYCELY